MEKTDKTSLQPTVCDLWLNCEVHSLQECSSKGKGGLSKQSERNKNVKSRVDSDDTALLSTDSALIPLHFVFEHRLVGAQDQK